MSLLPVLLGALAAALLLARPAPRRLAGLVARPAQHAVPPERALLESATGRRLAAAGAGLGLGLLVGGVPGLVVGGLCAAVGPRLLARLGDPAERERDELLAALPLSLDLLAACLAGGATLPVAARAVADGTPGPPGVRWARVAAALAVGSPPAQAWPGLGVGAEAAVRALVRADETGAPVAAAVARVAAQARETEAARATQRARRAGVLAVGPLGLCFLPAFLLLGVVPAVAGLADPLLSTF